jgi:hypothetical protein
VLHDGRRITFELQNKLSERTSLGLEQGRLSELLFCAPILTVHSLYTGRLIVLRIKVLCSLKSLVILVQVLVNRE